jgi:hypothetical protein
VAKYFTNKLLIGIYLSLFNNKYLTNVIDWFILCAMNANEISPKANFRLNRIKIVSRLAKWIVRLFFLGAVVFFFVSILPSPQQNFSARGFLIFGYQIILCVWYWKLAQLFQFYESGQIFAGKTIHCIKMLGAIWIAGWLLLTAWHFSPLPTMPVQAATPVGAHVVKTGEHRYRFGFVSFDFGTGIDFGQLFGGIVILLGAWIMDEGRKIQEEQELTV